MFLIDSNVLIEAKDRYYAFDIAPGFWQWLERLHGQSRVCSITPVQDELAAREDELAEWAKTHKAFFRPIDAAATRQFPTVANWAKSRRYDEAAVKEFLAVADFQLVAYARAHGLTLVTQEAPAPNAKRKVKIPDACLALHVQYINTFELGRKEKMCLW